MSLKGFHIVFIIFSTLLALGVGLWCVWVDLVEGAPIYLAGAIASFVAAVGVSFLLWREGWKSGGAYGSGDLFFFWRWDVGAGGNGGFYFSFLAAGAHPRRATSGDHRGRFEQI